MSMMMVFPFINYMKLVCMCRVNGGLHEDNATNLLCGTFMELSHFIYALFASLREAVFTTSLYLTLQAVIS